MTYQLLLTTLGQQKLAAAASAGGAPIRITEFAVGQGVDVDFSKRLDQQVLVSKRYQAAVESVTATNVAGQYEVVCIVPQDAGGWAIREIGLIDSAGDLIWVGQVPEVQKPVASSTAAVDYRIKAVISIDNPDVNLVIDANVVTATQAWVANNFVSNPRFAQFLDLAYPYGHKYWTHNKSNPKPLFDAMFGFETHWRRLEGVGLIAVKDGDAYISQPMLTLGQRGTTELATTERPHTYPTYTSYLFERYNPDDVVETVWRVSADKTSINEGDAVRFTVTANNLPDGQILDWAVKEGTLSADSNDIDAPEKSESGTVILKNGQAVIDFVTTPDDNTEEPQKHVRLAVGAPANLSVNVPITDKGHHETVLHISQSTTEGISLDEYYYDQYGAYSAATDTVRFIVDDGVDIIAPDTATPAITEGANWSSNNPPIVENHGRILGRGGDGGRSAYAVGLYAGSDAAIQPENIITAQKGNDGGTAIAGNIIVENYDLIAGGGGGGGGMGLWIERLTDGSNGYGGGGGGGTGGGAPLGMRSINEGTYQRYLSDPTAPTPLYYLPDDDRVYSSIGLGNTTNNVTYRGIGFYNNGVSHPISVSKSRAIQVPIHPTMQENFDAEFDGTYRLYITANLAESNGFSVPLKMSSSASIEDGGQGGYGGAVGQVTGWIKTTYAADVSKNKGGDGGGIGEDGAGGEMATFFYKADAADGSAPTVVTKDDVNYYENAAGGLAGYISQGNVTINNYGSGTTKGRVA